MRKLIYIACITLALSACNADKRQGTTVDEHSAEYALDYEGVYKETYPCADCSGIEVVLTLNADKSFSYETVYLDTTDQRFTSEGKYSVKENLLTIEENGRPVHFFIGEGSLTLLGDDLKPNTGELAEYYKLKKQ